MDARENALQNEVIELRNQVLAYEEVLATRREHAKLADDRYETLVADRDEWRRQHENALAEPGVVFWRPLDRYKAPWTRSAT